jgi:hypothetical protein
MKQITRDANVQELIKTFELEQPKLHKIETSDYYFDELTNCIIIKSMSVLDDDYQFVRQADLKKIINHLKDSDVTFRAKGTK